MSEGIRRPISGYFKLEQHYLRATGLYQSVKPNHIFPKSKLDAIYKDQPASERKAIVNDICNLAFMTKQVNIIKTNDDPESYFPKVSKKHGGFDYFNRQAIPHDLSLLAYKRYERFLDKRSQLLAKSTNDFLDAFK